MDAIKETTRPIKGTITKYEIKVIRQDNNKTIKK